ncbi:AAA family ATPase [Streptomyces sp. NPDC002644]
MERGHSLTPRSRTLAALAAALNVSVQERRRQLEEDVRALRRGGTAARPGLCEPPRAVADFTGRADELAVVRRAAADGDRGGPVPVVLVHEQAGVGKTTLALRAQEVPSGAVASSDEERCAQVRAALRERRCLSVLDNDADEAQVRPLLPGAGGFVLAACRRG